MGVDEANSTAFGEGECTGLPISYNLSGKLQYYYKNKKLVLFICQSDELYLVTY